MVQEIKNLYVHFPFCRRKCTYCALCSKPNAPLEERLNYTNKIALAIKDHRSQFPSRNPFKTIYFGGGSPLLCDLEIVFNALKPFIAKDTEFSVELHPLDATDKSLQMLVKGGVNRISMGVQSLDDETLKHMGRSYTLSQAKAAFLKIKEYFDNAGIDLITGYPHINGKHHVTTLTDIESIASWGIKHCSVYSLIMEEDSILYKLLQRQDSTSSITRLKTASDDEALDEIKLIATFLKSIGLNRYEVSNYAAPGYECKHNIATWRGEDYIGLGLGAHGRIGCMRTRNMMNINLRSLKDSPETEEVDAEFDFKERHLFALRTSEGIDESLRSEWSRILDGFVNQGLVWKDKTKYKLTQRGYEVCDTILTELI